jgi:glycosyltransferase involved in cell wall biosynthesis
MKILLVIDHLGLGGAQRQMVELGCGLKQRGHVVEVFVYFPRYDFFRSRVEDHGILVHECNKDRGFSIGVVRRLAVLMRHGGFDAAISYLDTPNIYSEFAKLMSGGPALIVSERCDRHADGSALTASARRSLHVLADQLVTNSQTHARWLEQKWWLKGKVSCIYNGVDLQYLSRSRPVPSDKRNLRLLAIGRICPQKNVLRLIEALHLFFSKHQYAPELSWVGQREPNESGEAYARQVDEALERLPAIRARWHWLGQQSDMQRLYREHDALIHPSLYEGLPNAVCEALAAGMPVLVSNVCDHPLLVAEAERGFLFDPRDAQAIAGAIERLAALDERNWQSMSERAREFAEQNLTIERMVGAYERLLVSLTQGRASCSQIRDASG